MIELVRAAAAAEPDRPAVITNDGPVDFTTLLRRSEAAASWLAARDSPRFAIVSQDASVVIGLLAGASLAGADACVYPPVLPGVVDELAQRFDHRLIVTDDPELDTTERTVSSQELFACADAPVFDPPARRPLLILTTGTTGKPKGVRHDWRRMVRSVGHVAPTPGQRWLLAYGLQQFGGMLMLIHSLSAQVTLVAPSPRRPREGLAAMREHDVQFASATPTFWRFLLAELRAGGAVPALTQITLSGEVVPERLLEDLRRTFPQTKIRQVWGANEAGSTRSVRDTRPGLPADLLEAGPDADLAFRIVDGQLEVRSKIGMLGYYGEPERDPDDWRPTGDLVELVGDRVLFRGRDSDVINVGGVKLHPLPIEDRIAGIDGVRIVRVFGRPNPITGAVVAAEIVAEPGRDTDALRDAIRDACADLPPAAYPRSIRFVDSIATSGNKIVRTPVDVS